MLRLHNLRAEAVGQGAGANASNHTARVADGQKILGHIVVAMLHSKERDVVEGYQHSPVDEEAGHAESNKPRLLDSLAAVLLPRLVRDIGILRVTLIKMTIAEYPVA